jgi:uncharacterized protein YhaN
MRISSLYIDGFGIFHDESHVGLDPGLVLFQGNNEAGKSTLLAFIRAVLFGFPRANSRDPSYPPLVGGTHGGRIGMVANNGEGFVVERKPGKGGGAVTITEPGGDTGHDELLQQLLGGVTYEVFKNIYAFSLTELQTIDTLKAESVKSVIYGASAGTAMLALPRANKQIKDHLEDLFKPGGSKPVINKKMTELEGIRAELREASKGIARYDQAWGELADVEERIQALRHDIAKVSRDRERFTSYDRLWPQWLALQETEKTLQQLEEVVESFPENGIGKLEKEIDSLKGHQNRMGELQDEIRQLNEEAQGLTVDEALLGQDEAVGFLLETRNAYVEKIRALPVMEQETNSLIIEIQGLIANLGKDWTEKTVLSIDRSLFTRESIRKHEEKLNLAERDLATADEILADKKDQFHRTVQEVDRAREVLERIGEAETEGNEQVIAKLQHGRDEFAGALRDIPKRESELQREQQQLDRLIREIEQSWTEADIDDFDISMAAQEKVGAFDLRTRRAETELHDEEVLCGTIEVNVNRLRERHRDAVSKLDNAPQPSASSREQLAKQKTSAQVLKSNLIKRSGLAQEIMHQEERLSDKHEELSRVGAATGERVIFPWKGSALGIAAIGLLAGGGLAMFGKPVLAGVVCGGLLAVAVVIYVSFRYISQKNKTIRNANQSIVESLKQGMEVIETKLKADGEEALATESKITELAKELDLSEAVTVEDVDALEISIEKDNQKFEQRDRLDEEVRKQAVEVRQSEKDLEAARKRADRCRKSFAAIQKEWKDHLNKIKLSTELLPALAIVIFSKVEAARQQLNIISSLKNRIREMEETLNGYLDQARKVPSLAPFCQKPEADLLPEVDKFFSRLQHQQKRLEERKLAQQTLQQKGQTRVEAEKTLEEAQQSFDKLEGAGAEALDNWQRWLDDRGLPNDLSPKTALEAFDRINDCVERINKRDQCEKSINDFKKDLRGYRESAANTFNVLERPVPDAEKLPFAVDELVSELDENKGNLHGKRQIEKRLAAARSQLETVRKQNEQCRRRIDDLLRDGAASDEEEFRKRGHLFLERTRLIQETALAEKNMRQISGEFDIDALRETLGSFTLEEIKSWEKDLAMKAEDLESEIDQLRNRKAELKQSIDTMKSADDIARLRADEERLLAEVQQDALEWARYAMARYLIDRARETFEKEQQPKVIRDAGGFFQRITGSRYTELFAPIGAETIEVITSKKERKNPELLSRGTAEQLYLAIRFGYIRNRTGSGEALPVIMDDILVNFDPIRAREAAGAIYELSRDHQVLYFTCHPEAVAAFREIDERVSLCRIEDGHLRIGD